MTASPPWTASAGNDRLRQKILMGYNCLSSSCLYDFDVELVKLVMSKLKCGKTACLDGITEEHVGL